MEGQRRGSAASIREDRRPSSLFDTFSGHPYDDYAAGYHKKGAYSDTGVSEVLATIRDATGLPMCLSLHVGVIPATFLGLEECSIGLAHLDLDLYQSTRAAVEFIWPRMVRGGILILDDYHEGACPGVRRAFEELVTAKEVESLGVVESQESFRKM